MTRFLVLSTNSSSYQALIQTNQEFYTHPWLSVTIPIMPMPAEALSITWEGNQTVHNNTVIQINMLPFLSGPRQPSYHRLPSEASNATPSPVQEKLSQGYHPITTPNVSDVASIIETTTHIIVQTTDMLIDRGGPPTGHKDLVLGVEIVEPNIDPDGNCGSRICRPDPWVKVWPTQSLLNVDQCREALLELLDRLNSTCQGLMPTKISALWRPVFGNCWDGNELLSLKMKLCYMRKLFRGFLMALNSYVSTIFYLNLSTDIWHDKHKCRMDGAWKRIMHPSPIP